MHLMQEVYLDIGKYFVGSDQKVNFEAHHQNKKFVLYRGKNEQNPNTAKVSSYLDLI